MDSGASLQATACNQPPRPRAHERARPGLEVENPGGLYGRVTIDKLQEVMGDMHLVENRGSGIDAMPEAMQKRGLPTPVFEDRRTSFLVKFYQVKPGSLALSDGELKILAYVKEHGSIRRAEAQKLLQINDTEAGYLLQKMRKGGPSAKRGTL